MNANRNEIIQNFRARIADGKRNKLSKQEFDCLIESLIQQLKKAKSSEAIHDICRSEIALLEEGYKKLTLASIYIPRYRAAIKDAIASKQLKLNAKTSHEYEYQQRVTGKREQRREHWALTYFKYTPEEYEQLDHRQAEVNQKRLSSLKTVALSPYLDAIETLLHSQEKFAARHQAIAIAALTGRRMGEVVARGTFTLTEHPYQLHFTGQQKYERDGYDILTLIPAQELVDRIQSFRQEAEIKTLLALEGKELKQHLNKFDVQINKECNRYLANIVPPLDGKKNVTIHNLRSLWGAIACHFFCPEDQHEYAFLQHYLGHVMKSSATGHYFRYQLVNAQGQRIKTKGIKLAEVPSSLIQDEPLERYPEESGTIEAMPSPSTANGAEAVATLDKHWQRRWETLDKRLTAVEASLSAIAPSHEALKITELTQENQELQAQNEQLAQQLQQAEDTLAQFRQLLLPKSQSSHPKTKAKPAVNTETIHQPDLPLASPPKPKKKSGRKPGKAIARAKSIFERVQDWNHQNPENTFATNPGFLESVFRINRKAAQQFCQQYQSEIQAHHQAVGIERTSSHNRGKDTQEILHFLER